MITARILVASALLAGVVVGGVVRAQLAARRLAARADRERRRGRRGGCTLVYMRAVLAMRVPEAHQVSRLIRAQLGRA